MIRGVSFFAASLVFSATAAWAQGTTWEVPRDFETIQGAVDAAANGDTVMVGPGRYFENIDFRGKAIAVRARHGAARTIIDGGGAASVVAFVSGEGPGSRLEGFTLTNGAGTGDGGINRGGAVLCVDSSPEIIRNVLHANTAAEGGAIFCRTASPLIAENEIAANTASEGAGIGCIDASSPIIAGNMIHGNAAAGPGGGLLCRNGSSPVLGHNTIALNTASEGGGLYCASFCSPTAVNSIFWSNAASAGPEAWIGGVSEPSALAISYSDVLGGASAIFVDVDCVLDWGDGMFAGGASFTDPGAGDFHLKPGSICVNAGNNLAPAFRDTDFEGDPRVFDGTTDMGADEVFSGATWLVPGQFATIRSAIAAAADGDVIVVDPGTYRETLNFYGKAVTVRSSDGAAATIIDGQYSGSVVAFTSGEGPRSVLDGFTVTNGDADRGAGIWCDGSSPTIRNNIVYDNFSKYGGGISLSGASPIIESNVILANDAWNGGGIYCSAGSYPVIASCLIHGNSGTGDGGGIACRESSLVVTNCSLIGNSVNGRGGGIYCTQNSLALIANTILWDDSASQGKEIWVGLAGSPSSVEISYSDVKGGQQSTYVTPGATLDWGAGMIQSDPQFLDAGAGDFRLSFDSVCRDAGDSSAPALPPRDFEGQHRVSLASVDIGADEYFMPRNVILAVIDGLRGSEGFDDPTHQYIPRIWNDLRPLGTIYTNFINQGFTVTTPGHATMTSGVTQFMPNNVVADYGFLHRIQEDPSIFQYYRSQLGIPQEKTWIVNGKGPMIMDTGICQNPYYGDQWGPMVSFSEDQEDDVTWIEVQRVMDAYHPSMMMINLRDVDAMGHTGDWELYINAIIRADEIIHELYQKIQADPYYRDDTALIITSDHGRHLDGIYSGFQDHGCSCLGCRRVPFLAIGPNIKKGAVVTAQGHLRDVPHTIGAILGFDVEYGNGRVLRDVFEVPPGEAPVARTHVTAAFSGNATHAAFCSTTDSSCSIVYARSISREKGWGGVRVLSVTPYNTAPCIAAAGNRVAVAWSSIHADGSCRVSLRESLNGGASWSGVLDFDGSSEVQYDLFPSICYRGDSLHVVWTEMKFGSSILFAATIRNSVLQDIDAVSDYLVLRARCAPSDAGVHVVYQLFDTDERNWDAAYCLYDGADWHTPVRLTTSPGESLRPDVAVDEDGIHVAWGEYIGGRFYTTYTSSTDGVTWNPAKLLGGSAYGDWHPRIAAAPEQIVVVWEDYEDRLPSIVARFSVTGGAAWSSPLTVAENDPGCLFPTLSADDSGRISFFWLKMPWPTQIGHRVLSF